MSIKKVLVLGASGYVGSRLVPRLLAEGYEVRAVSRSLSSLQTRPWADQEGVELFKADILSLKDLRAACQSCQAAYYLVHSMNPQHTDFAEADRKAAHNMVIAAKEAGLQCLIYLGGLGVKKDQLSKHLLSRVEVGEILKSGKVPVTILRAAMIIGSGSASFEILRYLVERLPIMITPKWVRTESQPIAIRNVLNYLVGCLSIAATRGKTFDIGGPEIVSYRKLMKIFAEEAGLAPRLIIPFPLLTPKLSSYWINLVTPIPAALARPLAEGLKNKVICQDNQIRLLCPQTLMTCRQAIRFTLGKEVPPPEAAPVQMPWSLDLEEDGAHPFLPPEYRYPGDPPWVKSPNCLLNKKS